MGWPPADLDLWRDDLAAYPADVKVARALELERAVRAGDPRIRAGRERRVGRRRRRVGRGHQHRDPGRRPGGRPATSRPTPSPGEGADTQTGGGYSVGRSPDDLDLDKAAGDAVERATRLLGAVKPQSAHLTVVFEPRDHRHLAGA